VVRDASGLDAAGRQAVAADVGYSETAFVTAADGADMTVRYFSPLAEVPFCGHATIATGVAWGDRHGPGLLRLSTPAGLVEVDVADGVATLTSVVPSSAALAGDDLTELLAALGWARADLDQGPMVRAGERVDDAFVRVTPAENVADEAEDAAEEVGEAARESPE
jgi:PhzF family phenazine biosynthesis protein